MAHHGADADGGLDLQGLGQGVLDVLGDLVDLLAVAAVAEHLDDGNVGFVNGNDKVLLAVGEHVLNHVHRGNLRRAHLADQEDSPLGLRGKVELLGPDIDVTQQNVVGDDALDKGGLVVLFLIVGLGAVEGHGDHGADELSLVVAALDKGGVVEVGTPVGQRFEGLVPVNDHGGIVHIQGGSGALPLFSDPGQLVAGYHGSLVVHDANDAVRALLHLEHDALKNSAGHVFSSCLYLSEP